MRRVTLNEIRGFLVPRQPRLRYDHRMFEGIKNMAGMAGLLKDLPKIKARMTEVKEDLERVTVEAETGGGAVRAIANGQLRVVGLHVDQPLLSALVDSSNPDDRAMAEDLIIGAVNAALEKARQKAEEGSPRPRAISTCPFPPAASAACFRDNAPVAASRSSQTIETTDEHG